MVHRKKNQKRKHYPQNNIKTVKYNNINNIEEKEKKEDIMNNTVIRTNKIPREILPERESQPHKKIIYDSRKASYYEKAHRYDLMAYAQLLCNHFSKEEAKEALKYFYTDIIDYIHQDEPQFYTKKTNTSTNNNYTGYSYNSNYHRSN